MTAPVAPRGIEALDVPLSVLEARLRAGRLAEQRHQVLDLDADSRFPVPLVLVTGQGVTR